MSLFSERLISVNYKPITDLSLADVMALQVLPTGESTFGSTLMLFPPAQQTAILEKLCGKTMQELMNGKLVQ